MSVVQRESGKLKTDNIIISEVPPRADMLNTKLSIYGRLRYKDIEWPNGNIEWYRGFSSLRR